MKLLLATQNEGKVRELKGILKAEGKNYEVKSLKDAGIDVDVPETSSTLLGNAILKAEAIHELVKAEDYDYVISEDFGFYVNAFPQVAGVHAKRWSEGTDKDRSLAVVALFEKTGEKDRSAKYVSVFVAINRSGKRFEAEGELLGEVGVTLVEKGGFAYDQILKMPDGKYLSEYSEEEKNKVSSRRIAVNNLLKQLS